MRSGNSKGTPHIIYEEKTKVLYLKFLRTIYYCLESEILWYNLCVKTMKGIGFKLNPYDLCVANKDINGKQCTMVFYVDDNEISHVDSEVVDDIIREISKQFGELSIYRGKEYNFLGMNIKIRDD